MPATGHTMGRESRRPTAFDPVTINYLIKNEEQNSQLTEKQKEEKKYIIDQITEINRTRNEKAYKKFLERTAAATAASAATAQKNSSGVKGMLATFFSGTRNKKGGYKNKKPSVPQSKEILGKQRRIYKVAGSRKEHIKYKGQLIPVSDYKKLMKPKH